MPAHGHSLPSSLFTISDSTNSASTLFVLCGSPTVAGAYTVTINPGVIVGGANRTTAAIRTGTFPAGSTVKLINKGYIYGYKGYLNTGGNAVQLDFDLTIDNTNGYIFGGGGAGGGGGSGPTGSAGVGGTGQGSPDQLSGPTAGSAGTGDCGAGGAGGTWGTHGSSGEPGAEYLHYDPNPPYYGYYSASDPGGTGFDAGYAVKKGNKTLTWAGGNTGGRVLGTVGT